MPATVSPAAPVIGTPAAAPAPAAFQADPWAPLLDAGLALVETLARRGSGVPGDAPAWIERDPASGREFIKLPLPEPQAVQRLAEALSGLLAGLRRG